MVQARLHRAHRDSHHCRNVGQRQVLFKTKGKERPLVGGERDKRFGKRTIESVTVQVERGRLFMGRKTKRFFCGG